MTDIFNLWGIAFSQFYLISVSIFYCLMIVIEGEVITLLLDFALRGFAHCFYLV